MLKLTGPFRQMITLEDLPLKGSLQDNQLKIISEGGILTNEDKIEAVGNFIALSTLYPQVEIDFLQNDLVCLPGMIDVHTHIAWAGSRAADYAARLSGKSYQSIAAEGGGIWNTVQATRSADNEQLIREILFRANQALLSGVTTMEVKSGYGLSVQEEMRILRCIIDANKITKTDLVPTCLAAHIKPRDFVGDEDRWLAYLTSELLPHLKLIGINRIDIFVEEGAFSVNQAKKYLSSASDMGFDLILHGDQFSPGSIELLNDFNIKSIDHLESVTPAGIDLLSKTDAAAVVLPGASLGMGMQFAPARKLLDAGCSLVIASDWNPGSAPMGDLLTQAALLGVYEKLSMAEVWAGMTFRAANTLRITDVGILKPGFKADFIAFPAVDYREILYHQGHLRPSFIWKSGKNINE
jgi:imidazolonepropionase